MNRIFYCFILLLILVSCSIAHNLPTTTSPNSFEKPNIFNSFVDQNGNFYPDNWSRKFGPSASSGKINDFSLMKIAIENDSKDELIDFEVQKMEQLAKRLKDSKRVFILVHGFNSDVKASNRSYTYVRDLLNINTAQDQVIRFYWDGLITKNPFGGAKTWFAATSFSQMAGEFGLRRVLNSMRDKDVYIISHSRGASVVLSALSTPAFKEQFAEDTKEIHHINVADANSLKENNNRITCIMLAPAIGLNDFRSKDLYKGDTTYRQITPQVKKVHITINDTDAMLKKVFGFLSSKLEPTDLGYKVDVFNELSKRYPFFEKTDFSGMKSHEFKRYVLNPKFKKILKTYAIAK